MGEAFTEFTHIRVGRVAVEQRVDADAGDMATIRRMYTEAVSVAGSLWESAQTEGHPDATLARNVVDGLAQAVAQNRTALLALTTLKNYDNYTFTHMVNVSILMMGQARALGIDGSLLREFGLAALMHDIGKVRTPLEVLNKPDKLTDAEFTIMKRHVVDGAEILRGTPDIPALAPVVAFEHHLRIDGTGYPDGAKRPTLNLGTMLCGIADVYDAMRSQRAYQQAFPTDRILEVLKRNDGTAVRSAPRATLRAAARHLPGRQLCATEQRRSRGGSSGACAGPLSAASARGLRQGRRAIEAPYDLNLWDAQPEAGVPSSIVAPLNPADYPLDPLTLV